MLPLVVRSDELVETVKQAINDAGVPHAVPRDENGRISLFRMVGMLERYKEVVPQDDNNLRCDLYTFSNTYIIIVSVSDATPMLTYPMRICILTTEARPHLAE